MNIYSPNVTKLNDTRIIIIILSIATLAYLVEFDVYFTLLIIGIYMVIEYIQYAYYAHKIIAAHRRLKIYGLSLTWLQRKDLHAKHTPESLLYVCESKLTDPQWREDMINILAQSEYVCTYDTYVEPKRLRWSLSFKFPDTWTEDDSIAGYFCVMSCLPDNQPWRIFMEDSNIFKIETYMYEFGHEGVVASLSDCPQISLYFWSTFQNDAIWLLGRKWSYGPPIFRSGVVDYIWFELPAKFLLDDEAYICINENSNDGLLYATVYDKDGAEGETKVYESENDFWFVWRHAIRKPG